MQKKNVPGLLLFAFAGMVLGGCSKDESFQQVEDGSVIVTMKNDTFSPLNTMIVQGGTVTWVNDDNKSHTIVSQDGAFSTTPMAPGARFTFRFTETGNYNYRCLDHAGIASVLVVTK